MILKFQFIINLLSILLAELIETDTKSILSTPLNEFSISLNMSGWTHTIPWLEISDDITQQADQRKLSNSIKWESNRIGEVDV